MNTRNSSKTKLISKGLKKPETTQQNEQQETKQNEQGLSLQKKIQKKKIPLYECQFIKFLQIVPPIIQALTQALDRNSQEETEQIDKQEKMDQKYIQQLVQKEVLKYLQDVRRQFNQSIPNVCEDCQIFISNFFGDVYRQIICCCRQISRKRSKTPNPNLIRRHCIKNIIKYIKSDLKDIQKGFETLGDHKSDQPLSEYRVRSPGNLIFPTDKYINDADTPEVKEKDVGEHEYMFCETQQQLDDYMKKAKRRQAYRKRREQIKGNKIPINK